MDRQAVEQVIQRGCVVSILAGFQNWVKLRAAWSDHVDDPALNRRLE